MSGGWLCGDGGVVVPVVSEGIPTLRTATIVWIEILV